MSSRKRKKTVSYFAKINKKKYIKHYNDYSNVDFFHPNYVYERIGDNCNYLSITHNKPNDEYVSVTNINPKERKLGIKSYVSKKHKTAHYSIFGRKLNNYSFDREDLKKIHSIIGKNKKEGK